MKNAKKKLIRYLICIFAIITLNFAIPRAMPGDPVMNLIGEDVMVSADTLNQIRSEIGLDRPVYEQFATYLWNLIHLDLGYSYHLHADVASLLCERMFWTLLFVGIAIILGAITGTYAGALSGWYSDSKISRAVTCVGMAVSCTPPYFLALIFLSVFVFRLGIFPFKALYDEPTIASVIHHLALPVIVMTLFSASRNFLIMRGSVIQEKNSHYALYARAKGLFDRGILWKHILKNASLPLITQVALDFGFIFSGAIFIEIVFSLNGMGTLIYDAILGRDYPVLQGAFLVIAITVILANLLADILYGIIDPRVRVNER